MLRCRPRSITDRQFLLIWWALHIKDNKATRNIGIAESADLHEYQQLERLGLMTFVHEVAGLYRFRVTERGAAEIGLELPEGW